MTGQERRALAEELGAIAVFRGVTKAPPISKLREYLSLPEDGDSDDVRWPAYGEFVAALMPFGCSLSAALLDAFNAGESEFLARCAAGEEVPAVMRKNAERELDLFSRLTALTAADLTEGLGYTGYAPEFDNEKTDFRAHFDRLVKDAPRRGFGRFARAGMFRISEGKILPVGFSDAVSLDSFVGYEAARGEVIANTEALMEGRPALDLLLYGDAGTGKSSTVKACANRFRDRGLRLIELRKDQLTELPRVMETIARNPLKFIIFIDDLSFSGDDDRFGMLKAALEGSAAGRAKNCVIYATGNRRHLVKEKFSDREGDDIHRRDTVGELLSLSDRFGKTVFFEKPDKSLYLKIVRELARRAGLNVGDRELELRAEAFALGKGSRSPRAAEQFVNSLQL